MQKKIMYHAAIYLRLSRDDEDIDGSAKRESDSISSQRELARSFDQQKYMLQKPIHPKMQHVLLLSWY